MDAVLRTPRTVLRRFTAADAAALVALDADPEVMRWLTGGRPTPPAVVELEVLPRILAGYGRDDGPGRLAAEDPSTGAFLGWFGLRPVEGRGLATEGARALVRLAFEDLGAERVYAETMTVNAGSRRVLEKAGLRHVRTFDPGYAEVIPGSEHGDVEYAVTAEQYRAG